MSHDTGHNSFTNQYLLNIYIYCRLCRLYIIYFCALHTSVRSLLLIHFIISILSSSSSSLPILSFSYFPPFITTPLRALNTLPFPRRTLLLQLHSIPFARLVYIFSLSGIEPPCWVGGSPGPHSESCALKSSIRLKLSVVFLNPRRLVIQIRSRLSPSISF
jgi:hypothetical protein